MGIPVKEEEQAPRKGPHGEPHRGTHSGDPHVLLDAHTALHLAGEESDDSESEPHIWRGID